MSNEKEKQGDKIQNKSNEISLKYHCQSGILTPFEINEHALYLICKYLIFCTSRK